MRAIKIDLDKNVEDFIDLKNTASTKRLYHSALSHFLIFFRDKYDKKATIENFYLEAYKDSKKDPPIRKQYAVKVLSQFIKYLQGLDKSDNTIRSYMIAMRAYLNYRHLSIKFKKISNFPKGDLELIINEKQRWTIDQIREFVRIAPYREKAIIVCLFQSGLSISDLLSLNYGDIKQEYENGTLPIMIDQKRIKTNTRHYTFFGYDAVNYS